MAQIIFFNRVRHSLRSEVINTIPLADDLNGLVYPHAAFFCFAIYVGTYQPDKFRSYSVWTIWLRNNPSRDTWVNVSSYELEPQRIVTVLVQERYILVIFFNNLTLFEPRPATPQNLGHFIRTRFDET